MGGADKRKADLSDSDDDFAPSAEASPEVKPKPKKKSKPKAAEKTKPKPELADDDDGTQASPKDKKKKEAALDYGVDITTYDQSPELTAKYSAMSVTELNQWLKANRVVKGAANKANMVARCVDGELFGAFPPCPRCVTGKLKVTYASLDAHGGQGEWTCRGAFDEAIGMRVKCYFTARPGEVTRAAVEGHARSRARAREARGEARGRQPPTTRSFQTASKRSSPRMPPTPSRPSRWRWASSCPPREPTLRSRFFAAIFLAIFAALTVTGSTKDDEGRWDGAATLKALREKYPPLTNEEAAGGPPATHPDNSALASCLDELVRLETKHKEADAFKLFTYGLSMTACFVHSSSARWRSGRSIVPSPVARRAPRLGRRRSRAWARVWRRRLTSS